MPTLLESLASPNKRSSVITDCVTLIDKEVESKGGLSGFAIKAGYKVVKNVKPGFITEVVDGLLDDFCKNLQPLADDAQSQQRPIGSFFTSNRSRVAEALLSITDEKVKRSKMTAIKSAYEGMRGMAKRNVEDAAPRIGGLVEKHSG